MSYVGKKSRPAKSPVNLSIDAEILTQAKSLRMNLSDILEQRLRELIRLEAGKAWLEENRAWIDTYTAEIEREGVWSDGKRLF
jgi:antitoxin CcdA